MTIESQTLLGPNQDIHDDSQDEQVELHEQHVNDSQLSIKPKSVYPSINLYTILAICCACIGGLMFGYDTGCVSQILQLLNDDLGHELAAWELELITSSTSLFALIGSVLTGVLADRFGRKTLIGISCVIFIISAIIMAVSNTLSVLVFGRSLVGLSVGSASTIVNVYIAEISPPSHRGRLVALNSVSTTGGQVLAYLSGVIFQHVENGWRYILGISGIPPVLFLFIMNFIPESPRYLIMKGKIEEATEVLFRLDPSADINSIEETIQEHMGRRETDQGTSPLFRLFSVPSNFRALIVGCGLMASQQLCGFNGFMYFSVRLFAMIGFNDPVLVSLVVSITNFLFTWVAVKYVDRVGRRAILLRTVWIMVVALITTAYSFTKIDSDGSLNVKIMTVISTIVFVAAYATGLGNIPWQAIEFLPLDVRSLGSMFISSTNWVCNTAVSATFLSLLKWITPGGTFLLYGLITSVGYVGIYLYYPEVAGLPLEEVNDVFKQGWKGLGRRKLRA